MKLDATLAMLVHWLRREAPRVRELADTLIALAAILTRFVIRHLWPHGRIRLVWRQASFDG